jgi:hypothetical protein
LVQAEIAYCLINESCHVIPECPVIDFHQACRPSFEIIRQAETIGK